MSGWGVHQLGWGWRWRFQKTARGGQPAQLPQQGKLFLLSQSATAVVLLTNDASAPRISYHASAGMLHTKSFPRQQGMEGAPGVCVCVCVCVCGVGGGGGGMPYYRGRPAWVQGWAPSGGGLCQKDV